LICRLAVGSRGWRVVLGFEAFCDTFTPDSHRVEDFSTLYVMRKFFAARSGLEKLIINLADNDHGWRETVIRVSGAWEVTAQKDCGVVPSAWNQEALQRWRHWHGGSPEEDPTLALNWLLLPQLELVVRSEPTFCASSHPKGSVDGSG